MGAKEVTAEVTDVNEVRLWPEKPPSSTRRTALATYTWSLEGADAGDFDAFSISGGELAFKSAPDYENPADADVDNDLHGDGGSRLTGPTWTPMT